MAQNQAVHEVVCMCFSSSPKAEEAKSAIKLKAETPYTILDELGKWNLVTFRQVSDKAGVITFLQGLPPQAEQTIYVGVEIIGEKHGYEVLDNRNEAFRWLSAP